MTEAKLIEKIRRTLIDDATIKGYVQDRVYASHISSVDSPKYPAISITLLPGSARENVPVMVDVNLQIDLWFPLKDFTSDDVLGCYGQIRTLLHGQNLWDATIGVKVYRIVESGIGPLMPDPFEPCNHLPARYRAVAI